MAETKTFAIRVDTAGAPEAGRRVADALADLRTAAATTRERLGSLQSQLSTLKAGGDAFASAAEGMSKQVLAEQVALAKLEASAASAGTSLRDLQTAHDAERAALKRDEKALEEAGKARDKLSKESTAASIKDVEALESVAAGAAAMGVALVAAFGAAGLAIGRFVFESANAARAMGLDREAAVGSAEGAKALGTQVDALARKVPTAKAELNGLATELARSGLGGQALVDTFNAVGQAAAANGQAAGATIRGLLERGKVSQRFSLGRLELQGTGVAYDEVVKTLAKNLKVGVGEAQMALAEGRVSLSAGAEALRGAVEARFGAVNAKKMLDLTVLSSKLRENLSGLAADANLEKGLGALGDFTDVFSEATVSGKVLKSLVSGLGTAISEGIGTAAPFITGFLKGLIITALDVRIAYLKVKIALKEAFASNETLKGILDSAKSVDGLSAGITAAKVAVGGLAVALVAAGAVIAATGLVVAFPFILAGAAIAAVVVIGKKVYDFFKNTDFGQLGTNIIDGLVGGLKGGFERVKGAVTDLGSSAKSAFKNSLGIRSPSKVFAEYGDNTAQGYAQGVERSAPMATSAVASMVDVPEPAASAPASPAGGSSSAIVVNINVSGDSKAAAAALSEASFLDKLEEALRRAVRTQASVEVTA